MTSLALFIAQRLEREFELADCIGYSAEEVKRVVESAIAEHDKANTLADSSAQDAEDRAADGPLCQHFGKHQGDHYSFASYCYQRPTADNRTFTPADPTKEKS